jgi:HSP20 family protein
MAIQDLVPRRWRRELAPWVDEDSPLLGFQREMNKLIEDFRRTWFGDLLPARSEGAFIPNVDVTETDKTVQVTAELPGMNVDEIEVTLQEGNELLTLKGEKKIERTEEKKGFYHSERAHGTFHRTIRLPMPVDPERVEARFENGVLHMSLTKMPEAKPRARRIAVKTG